VSLTKAKSQVFIQTDIRNWLQPRICETCKKLDFETLAADTDSSRASFRPRAISQVSDWEPDASLGSFADVILRADHCNLCNLIANVSRKRKLLESYSDFSKASCGISLEAYAMFVLSDETVNVNKLNITVIEPPRHPFPETIV
jgi:hypothetical protein